MVEHARAVIIGGGVGGTSIAYHLTELGWTDIVLVDRAELTSGSTFHSAGLVGQLRSSVTLTKMMMYGSDLYRRLAAETGTDRLVNGTDYPYPWTTTSVEHIIETPGFTDDERRLIAVDLE